MIYKYIPDTIEVSYKTTPYTYEEFLEIQKLIRGRIENILKQYIDFSELDKKIEEVGFPIPLIKDTDYNFYHKFSTLGSKYIFLRNNIHIEKLNDNDRDVINNYLVDYMFMDDDFILKILPTVLFEEGDMSCFGTPLPSNMAASKSIVFEFAYDEYECQVKEGILINQKFDEVFKIIKETIETNLHIEVSKLVCNGFDKILRRDTDESTR